MVMSQCTYALTLVSPPLSFLRVLVKSCLLTLWSNAYHRVSLCSHQWKDLLDWICFYQQNDHQVATLLAQVRGSSTCFNYVNHLNPFSHRKVNS